MRVLHLSGVIVYRDSSDQLVRKDFEHDITGISSPNSDVPTQKGSEANWPLKSTDATVMISRVSENLFLYQSTGPEKYRRELKVMLDCRKLKGEEKNHGSFACGTIFEASYEGFGHVKAECKEIDQPIVQNERLRS